MLRTYIVLADGTEIFSGAEGAAVMESSLTYSVCNQRALTPGSVCAAMAEVTLLEHTPLNIAQGDALTIWQVDEENTRRKLGVFLAEKPVREGSLLRITAYDKLRLLDKDLSGFLSKLEGWPYSLLELAQLCCQGCGLELKNEDIPNGNFPVEKFSFDGVTGRMVMEWVAQAAGCYCIADEMGQPWLTWFTPAELVLAPQIRHSLQISYGSGSLSLAVADGAGDWNDGQVTLESSYLTAEGQGEVSVTGLVKQLTQYCLSGGLSLEEPLPPVEKIVLRQKETDVGTAYPENTNGTSLCITGNPLLAAKNSQTLLPVAQTLYERFGGLSYTPGKLTTPVGVAEVGQQVTVIDHQGRQHRFYIMQLQRTANGDVLTCTGSDREKIEAVENRSARSLAGKMLLLQADVDGLRIENADNGGKLSRLALDVSGITGQVSALEGQTSRLTSLEQTAQGLALTVEKIQTQGAEKIKTAMGYTFDDSGLRIARDGQQMENLLDNTGMYVKRSGQVILQANHRGVTAQDVSVASYLVIGDHARLENYTAGRTACFWLEG